MAIGKIIPKDDSKRTCDMTVQLTPRGVRRAIIGVPTRKVPYSLKTSE